ncbi:MAG: methyl-accepting chemotaxis protein [Butyrivibrio sp.]|nr:methyl-accepting chemotaxis protein [Butyrivibrio sp.]
MANNVKANAKSSNKHIRSRKGMGILPKMLVMILPVVIIALLVVALVSSSMAKTAVNEQTANYIHAELDKNINIIDGKLEKVRTTAEALSIVVSNTYQGMPMTGYADTFGNMVLNDDLISGAGIWFEPNTYTGDEAYAGQEYVGPYWYEDNGSIVEDWSYSNAEYDYFSQEYYLNAKAMTSLKAVITDPYYDPSSGTIMASCSAPIYDINGKFMGCVTCDMTLDIISTLVSEITVGDSGNAMMTTGSGVYIYAKEEEKMQSGLNIADDEGDIATIASSLLSQDEGMEIIGEPGMYLNAFFSTVPEVGWKLIIIMFQSEINAPITNMNRVIFMISAIAIIVAVVVIGIIAKTIAGTISSVNDFARVLASGDFTVNSLKTKRNDELGDMSDSLNEMFKNNSNIISNISSESGNINDASSTLGAMSEELAAEFSKISENMVVVNDAMMSTGAATEEVSASVQEVNTSVEDLARETESASREVKEIKKRALDIQENSRRQHDIAINIANERRDELEAATARAEVVNEIANLANAISEIASQINLLSLNASIEAARAGDAGKGFAVVAQEINKLATETDDAVKQIQDTVDSVQEAFTDLSTGSNKLLEFVTETVTPDYDSFIQVGEQYGNDANLFGDLSDKISEMAENIQANMNEVNKAVQSIAESTQETASRSADVTDSVSSVSDAVDSVADLATKQQATAGTLTEIVSQFKLK